MEHSRQEYWYGLPFPSPGDLPHPEIEAWSPALYADSLLSESSGPIILITAYWHQIPSLQALSPCLSFPHVGILIQARMH